MKLVTSRCLSLASPGLSVILLLGARAGEVQAPGPVPSPGQQERLPERDRLVRQVDELRRAGKLDEAVAAAERALELERRAAGPVQPSVAEALSRLAGLHELRGDWDRALARHREALAVRGRVDGRDHWRTADARLAVAFAERVAGLGAADRAKIQGALRKEREADRLESRGEYAGAERAALEALEAYRAVVGPEAVEVARVWHRIGRARGRRDDARGAREAIERA